MNEIEQKEIEEMAKSIYESKVPLDGTDLAFGLIGGDDHFHRIAIYLYKAGYRNCKDKMVLSKEEYARLKYLEKYHITCEDVNEYMELAQKEERKKMQEEIKQASELKAETIRLAKQQTAMEILLIIKREYDYIGDLERIIAKQYEVEVE